MFLCLKGKPMLFTDYIPTYSSLTLVHNLLKESHLLQPTSQLYSIISLSSIPKTRRVWAIVLWSFVSSKASINNPSVSFWDSAWLTDITARIINNTESSRTIGHGWNGCPARLMVVRPIRVDGVWPCGARDWPSANLCWLYLVLSLAGLRNIRNAGKDEDMLTCSSSRHSASECDHSAFWPASSMLTG